FGFRIYPNLQAALKKKNVRADSKIQKPEAKGDPHRHCQAKAHFYHAGVSQIDENPNDDNARSNEGMSSQFNVEPLGQARPDI
ncbi:MAG: hypothetical protein JRN22_05280, partial [Nitrososphaerota archaeon]|nr:hypothetical protein [Nitrososphaerota archaeon]